jgi:hypothetical protein
MARAAKVTAVTTRSADERQARAAAIYGTILVLAVLAAFSEDQDLGPGRILAGMVTSSLVYWLAHVYAEVLADSLAGSRASLSSRVRHAAVREWPLVAAVTVPAVPLLLGAIGLLSRSTALALALTVAVGNLVGWGYSAARASGQTPVKAALSALIAGAFGAVMVALKGQLH